MTKEKLREIVAHYRKRFEEQGVELAPHPHNKILTNRDRAIAHLADMLPKMEQMIKEDKIGKVMRWLGFVQGTLWALGLDTIEELKEINRPDEVPV
ncbi:MAG: hypothetical protein KBD47_02880 [Candidatus Pacebacteria bacterium]|nr:hypothetical protein [Candidatus Paceibacterota bacterium]